VEPIRTLTVNPAVDQSSSIDVVVPEEKLRCESPRFDPGGGGVNVARVVHRLGGSPRAVYAAGGRNGDFLEELLERESLDHRRVEASGETRVNLVVLETTTGKQYRFGMPGAALSEEAWTRCLDAALEELEPPGYLVASGGLAPGMPPDFYAHLARRARTRGVRLVVDTSGEPLVRAADEGVHLLKPNLRELGQLVDARLSGETAVRKAARRLVEEGRSEIVVVSVGSGGALYVTERRHGRVHAPLVPIESKVGAGDSMVGGLVLALARGRRLEEAVRFGVAAGSATVMTPGTRLCEREDVEGLVREMKRTDGERGN